MDAMPCVSCTHLTLTVKAPSGFLSSMLVLCSGMSCPDLPLGSQTMLMCSLLG